LRSNGGDAIDKRQAKRLIITSFNNRSFRRALVVSFASSEISQSGQWAAARRTLTGVRGGTNARAID
jgi:hypothetical protein